MLSASTPAGAGRVIAREHGAQHAPRIPREGVLFREPPDMAGGPCSARKGALPAAITQQATIEYRTVLGGIDRA